MTFNNGLNINDTGVVTLNSDGTFAGSTVTQYQVVLGDSSNALTVVSGTGSATQVLTSNGAGMPPTWEDAGGSGLAYTTDTKNYPISSTWSSGGMQASTISTSWDGAPTWVQPMYTYLANQTSGGNGFCVVAGGSAAATYVGLYLFTLTNGSWSTTPARLTVAKPHVECRGSGGNVAVLISDAAVGPYSVDVYTPTAGAWGSPTNLISGSSTSSNSPCGLSYNGNIIAFYRSSVLQAYYFSGSWTGMTNSPVSLGAAPDVNYGAMTYYMSSISKLLIGYHTATPGYTIVVYDVTGGGTTITTTPVQTITLSGNMPDGNAGGASGWTYISFAPDETDVTYPYFHLMAGGAQNPSATANTGMVYSYQYSGGTFTYRNALQDNNTSGSFFTFGSGLADEYQQGYGLQAFGSGGVQFLAGNRYGDGHSRLYTLTKTAGAPYITYTLVQDFQYSLATLSNVYTHLAVDESYGDWVCFYDNNNNTSSYRYIRWYPMGTSGSTDVDYSEVTPNSGNLEVERLYCNSILKVASLASGTISSLAETIEAGSLVFNTTANTLMFFGNNQWNVIPVVSWNGTGANSGYFPNSGNLSLNGKLQNCTGIELDDGANQTVGVSSPLSAGSVTVNTTAVEGGSYIFLTRAAASGTLGVLSVGTITPATSFEITSSNAADTSTVNWLIINPS